MLLFLITTCDDEVAIVLLYREKFTYLKSEGPKTVHYKNDRFFSDCYPNTPTIQSVQTLELKFSSENHTRR